MSTNKQDKAKQNLPKKIEQLSKKVDSKPQIQWLLRSLLVRGKSNFETGFVLPTVAMVSLVVVLLSVALVVRAFDRSKNASNVRVNQVVLNAATPALDRAKAKLDALFKDSTLPRSTPSDIALNIAIKGNKKYDFGDETRLKLVNEFNGTAGIQKQPATTLEGDETIDTAWKYPVDTNNDGKFDSYTLYGIYFRSPSRDTTTGKFNRQRNPLEARTPPMSGGTIGNQCANANATTANLVGDSSWYKSGSKLTKSFYVYTATVPITTIPNSFPPGLTVANYQIKEGNKGFTALEYQQDRSQIPLTNNAVVFQDDLELSPGPNFNLNGRVFTNANLLIGGRPSNDKGNIRLFQVSSKNSCYYKEENAKITVGGNVGTGNINDTTDQKAVAVDLFNGFGNEPVTGKEINSSNKSTTSTGGAQVGYNDTAYDRRIDLMKRAALAYSTTNPPTKTSVDGVSQYPKEVKEGFKAKVSANASLDTQKVLANEIETYLRDRTRRVPYAEIATPDDANAITFSGFTTGIEPPVVWREPTDANTRLTLSTTQLEQTDPDKQKELGKEVLLGDRVNVGNNLPAYWKDALGKFVTGPFERQFLGSTVFWNNPADKPRFRTTKVVKLPDLGISERTGFWEDAAARTATATSNTGGLRVVTGAGIYVDDDGSVTGGTPSYSRATFSFLRKPTLDAGVTNPAFTTGNDNIVTWTDTMPMTGGAADTIQKGDLQMRATAIYHYKDASFTITTNTDYINRTPTACISSYYNPTNSDTAKNTVIDGGYGVDATNGRSNNGVVYPAPYTTDATRVTAVGTYRTQLNRQARLIFPNGRIVNEPLRNALVKIDASGTRSLVDNSAIDTAICGIRILSDTTFLPSATPPIAHGAIKESSFLDARQAKALDKSPIAGSINPISPNELSASTTLGNYNLPLEQRQPLEIRATDINMGVLRTTTIGGTTNQEYLLPNSGIIYATRDDALLDLSDNTTQKELLSPTDFKLDPTRRPNGIRLINGANLARDNNFRQEEKGLILVTDLPVYIRGNFNQHFEPGTTTLREEFTVTLDATWSNFYSRTAATLNADFACRINQLGCGSKGDQWRPATIISDATSLMSASFVDGFRDWGDYDLNNNAGISATQARRKNGFWDNSFITNPVYWNTTLATGLPNSGNSYLTNGIAPVQRRVKFPEYLMEMCTKIPVSTCGTNDWYVNPTTQVRSSNVVGQTFNITLHTAGTTATPANNLVRRYARRLAVARKPNGSLVLTDPAVGKASPIPLGIDSNGKIAAYPYTGTYTVGGNTYPAFSSSNKPQLINNTLWYRVSTDYNDPTPRIDRSTTSFASDLPLQYLGDNKLLLPNTACIKKNTSAVGSLVPCPLPSTPWDTTIANLNRPTADPASGYAVCVFASNKGSNKKYNTNPDEFVGTCPGTNNDTNTVSGVIKGTGEILSDITSPNPTVGSLLTATGGTLTASSDVNVYQIPSSVSQFNNGATITLKSNGNPNAVFIIKAPSGSFSFGAKSCSPSCNGVTVDLSDNDPNNTVEVNNVFWLLDGGSVQFEDVTTPHQIKGTVFGGAAMHMGNMTEIEGRLLGNSNAVQFTNPSTSKVTAITSVEQPGFIPVLQIHSPEGTPGTTLNTGGSIPSSWIQQAGTETTFNVAFVTGNSPNRPAEESAGLHNFVRFMENWGAAVNIKGSFIQLRKSAYATGPFSPLRSTGTAPIANPSASNDGSLSIFNYPNTYYPSGGGAGNTLTFYGAPGRQWGFDVALLTQPPDLFAQRFTQQSEKAPDEFFRQVGQDDRWVNNLLCAAQGSGTTYTAAIGDQRPASCPALSSYND